MQIIYNILILYKEILNPGNLELCGILGLPGKLEVKQF